MTALNILSIKILVLSIISLFSGCNKPDEQQDESAIFKTILEEHRKDSKLKFIVNKIGPVIFGKPSSKGSIEMAESIGLNTFPNKEDLSYMDEQINKLNSNKKNLFWSEKKIIPSEYLIDVFKISPKNKVYSKKWWIYFENNFHEKYVTMYSYPLFNKSHSKAFITYRIFSSDISQNSGYINYYLEKSQNDKWKITRSKFVN